MKKTFALAAALGISLWVVPTNALGDEEPVTPEVESTVPAPKAEGPSWVSQLLLQKGDGALLTVGARFDTAFILGGAVSQGFSLPSVRLTAFGDAAKWIHYRLSLGQTREFSSALLPQITPVEAYVDLGAERVLNENGLRWRLGMFTPTLNPWWSPDLSDLAIPDYNESHRRIFLSRDLGTELAIGVARDLTLFAGAFNGNGIVGLNTNNARAFTAGVRFDFDWARWKFSTMLSGFTSYQASLGSVNYKNDAVGDLSLMVKHEDWGVTVGADFMVGNFRSYLTSNNPLGGSFFTEISLSQGVRLFARAEVLSRVPTTNYTLNHFQLGPEVTLGQYIRAYFLYDYLYAGTSAENTFLGRVRLSL